MKIISGGQTGVDRAALDVALELHIECGGFCPKGRKSEDGMIPEKYPLIETATEEYSERTRLNIKEADATFVLIDRQADKGALLTIELCKTHNKKLMEADLSGRVDDKQVVQWILNNKITILNIAGSRETSSPGIYEKAYRLLRKVMIEIVARNLM
ncbi:MAG TPA: putative molybdenum carrier protein [Parafilimonas sp.]|nr:putative molybdenum carrier protein [Parafilimonas sp.]